MKVSLKGLLKKITSWMNVPLKVTYVTVQLGRTFNSHVSLTVPSVSGYSFVCWLTSASIGWVCNTYVNQAENSLWNGNTGATGSGTGSVRVYALFVKNP